MREVRLELLRPDQIIAEKERCAIAYLPIGPLEWHGPAAPFGTDPLTAHESAVRCAREVGGVVLPPLFMGVDTPRDEQGLQNLGFEIANKAIENAQLRAQLSTLQSENEQLKSRIDELSKGESNDGTN